LSDLILSDEQRDEILRDVETYAGVAREGLTTEEGPEQVEIVNQVKPIDYRAELKAVTAGLSDMAKTVAAGNKASITAAEIVATALAKVESALKEVARKDIDLAAVVSAIQANTKAVERQTAKHDALAKAMTAEREIILDEFDNPVGMRLSQKGMN